MSSSSRSSSRTKRFSRAQLERNLQILTAAVAAPLLPSTLPPSPPASRSQSPVPSPNPSALKRKLPQDAASSSEQSKRSRTSLQHADVHQQDVHTRSAPPPSRKDEDLQPPTSSSSTPPVVLATAPTPGGPEPASFPHRRGKPSAADFTRFHERYSLNGKFLKYSAEIRNQAASLPYDQQQRKLNPCPSQGSAYATHAQLFSRIEAVDALLNFTYAMWCKDMVENKCHHGLWDTIDQFLKWVRSLWEKVDTRGEAQQAFIGIIRMVEAFIYARKAAFLNTGIAKRLSEVNKLVKPPPAADPASSISPATSLGGSSQHSVPNASPPSASCPSPIATPAPSRPPTASSHPPSSAAQTPHPVLGPTVVIPKDLYESLKASHNCSARSARAMFSTMLCVNLPILARSFPRTAARLQAAQLRIDEEFEVDFDQDECSRAEGVPKVGLGGDPSPGPGEGQLVWPGPLNSLGGEGVAWVCLLGRAMLREMAYPMGYRGLEGISRKDTTVR